MTKINKELFDRFIASLTEDENFDALIEERGDKAVTIKDSVDDDPTLEALLQDFNKKFGAYHDRAEQAAIVLQKNFRGKKGRDAYVKQKEAALKIQKVFRGKKGKDAFVKLANILKNKNEISKRWENLSKKCQKEIEGKIIDGRDLNEKIKKEIEQLVLKDYNDQKDLALQSLVDNTVDLSEAPFAKSLITLTAGTNLDPKTAIESAYKNAVQEAPKEAAASVMINSFIEKSLPAQNFAQKASTGAVKLFSKGMVRGKQNFETSWQDLGGQYGTYLDEAKKERAKYGEEVRNTFAYLEALALNSRPGDIRPVGEIREKVLKKIDALHQENDPEILRKAAGEMIDKYRKEVKKVYGKEVIKNSLYKDGVRTWGEVEAKLAVYDYIWPTVKMGGAIIAKTFASACYLSAALLSAAGAVSHIVVEVAMVATLSLIAAAVTAVAGAILSIGKGLTATDKLVGENHMELFSASKGVLSAACKHIKGLVNAYREEIKGLMSENDNPNREEIKGLMSEETYDSVAREQRSMGDVFGNAEGKIHDSETSLDEMGEAVGLSRGTDLNAPSLR